MSEMNIATRLDSYITNVSDIANTTKLILFLVYTSVGQKTRKAQNCLCDSRSSGLLQNEKDKRC